MRVRRRGKIISGAIASQLEKVADMTPILKTVNPVTLSFAEAVLKAAGIDCYIMDQHASIVDGSIGAIPRRMMVLEEDRRAAVIALEDAGLGDEVHRA